MTRFLAILTACLLAQACATHADSYKRSDAMFDRIQQGMTREQVRFLLGTPLLTDIFHADRWDYVYWRETEKGKRESRRVALFFSDGKLARIEGDVASPAAGR